MLHTQSLLSKNLEGFVFGLTISLCCSCWFFTYCSLFQVCDVPLHLQVTFVWSIYGKEFLPWWYYKKNQNHYEGFIWRYCGDYIPSTMPWRALKIVKTLKQKKKNAAKSVCCSTQCPWMGHASVEDNMVDLTLLIVLISTSIKFFVPIWTFTPLNTQGATLPFT